MLGGPYAVGVPPRPRASERWSPSGNPRGAEKRVEEGAPAPFFSGQRAEAPLLAWRVHPRRLSVGPDAGIGFRVTIQSASFTAISDAIRTRISGPCVDWRAQAHCDGRERRATDIAGRAVGIGGAHHGLGLARASERTMSSR